MLRKVLLGSPRIIVVLVALIFTRASTFRVERTTRIAQLRSGVRAGERLPCLGPVVTLGASGPVDEGHLRGTAAGTGATYAWTGNDKVGEGAMRIIESRPPQSVALRLEFIKPMASVNRTDFTFKPDGTGTQVDWVMTGPLDFMGKGMDLFVGMDRMIGPDFEKGLAAMRREAEADAKKRAEAATASATPPAPAEPAPAAAPAK